MMGIKVKIQLPHDPTGRDGIKYKLPDVVTVNEPKDDDRLAKITAPYAQNMAVTGQSVQAADTQQQAIPQQQQQQQPQIGADANQ